ncbi:hypothetical protein BZL29_0200 [Mycobacterium kansasii]|uniref:Uncharacterized protein n=1 Tax=Mycobacterium kansasii TaxID=1768 RepID=A0A1V3XXJ1_MYCKA|nr:hypothetical protein BZL29_0200 [Mycobacterium kansasii]
MGRRRRRAKLEWRPGITGGTGGAGGAGGAAGWLFGSGGTGGGGGLAAQPLRRRPVAPEVPAAMAGPAHGCRGMAALPGPGVRAVKMPAPGPVARAAPAGRAAALA